MRADAERREAREDHRHAPRPADEAVCSVASRAQAVAGAESDDDRGGDGVGGDADATDHVPHPAARVVAYLCFAVVLVAGAAGIGVIVAHGLGMRLVMDGLVPTFVAK